MTVDLRKWRSLSHQKEREEITGLSILKDGKGGKVTRYELCPSSVCSSKIVLDVDGSTTQQVQFVGGRSDNSQGIDILVQGMKVDDVTRRLWGIRCGRRNMSCPDQFAQVLLLYQFRNEAKNQALSIKEESADFRDEVILGREAAQEYLPYSWHGRRCRTQS